MKKKLLAGLAAGVIMLGIAGLANANLISNGSFEQDSSLFIGGGDGVMVLTPSSTQLTSWTITGSKIAWIGPDNTWSLAASDGNFFLDLTSYSYGGSGGVAQTVVSTIVGQSYTLSFDLGSSTTYGAATDIIATASAGPTTGHFYTTATGVNNWDTFTMSFVADSTTTSVGLTGVGTDQARYYIGLDNVQLNAASASVPDPATLLLFGTGLIGLAGLARRRKI